MTVAKYNTCTQVSSDLMTHFAASEYLDWVVRVTICITSPGPFGPFAPTSLTPKCVSVTVCVCTSDLAHCHSVCELLLVYKCITELCVYSCISAGSFLQSDLLHRWKCSLYELGLSFLPSCPLSSACCCSAIHSERKRVSSYKAFLHFTDTHIHLANWTRVDFVSSPFSSTGSLPCLFLPQMALFARTVLNSRRQASEWTVRPQAALG